MLAFSRPFLPLFLHVLGAMTLFGSVLAVLILAATTWTLRETPAALARAPFLVLLTTSVPAWVVTVVGAHWIASKEGLDSSNVTWINVGGAILEPGVIVLLATIGVAYWWRRSLNPLAGRFVVGLASVYLVLLGVAWLAMSGKWGS